MSLSSSSLSTSLQGMANVTDFASAGQAWANAYGAYAANGQTVLNHPASVTAAKATLATALAAAFAGGVVPATTAAAMAAAFAAFWLTPPVAFVGSFPGAVTAVGGTAALSAALSATMAANVAASKSRKDSSDAMAAVLDTFTKTVIVTTATVPTPTVGPIF